MPAVVAVIAGCTMAPKYERPVAPIPTTLPTGAAYSQGRDGEGARAPADVLWQDFFADERLTKVIAMALENNRDLRIAALNVERAGALYGVSRAELLPAVNASAAANRQHTPAGFNGNNGSSTSTQYGVNLGVASWEIDFFGRIRSFEQAALQQYLATEQARHSAQILLVSSVASTYLTLAADRENLRLAQTTLESQQEGFKLIKQRFDQGISAEVDVFRAQGQVDVARRDIARYTQLVARDENALNLLAGTQVADELKPATLGEVTPPSEIAAGVSSEVLLRRPDVLQAENLLKAANANIGAARAAFFPRISLTGAVGTASNELSGLFQSGSGTWNYGPQIVMPIFDARVWAAKRVSNADTKIAVAQYERAIQVSFREVADALAVRGTVDEQIAAQESLVNSFDQTYRVSNVRYTRGVDSYLSVLDAQRSLFASQQALVFLRLSKAINQITLYSVLGGGWQPSEVPPTTQPTSN